MVRKAVKHGSALRGAAGRARVDEEIASAKAKEEARKARGHEPMRFWMPEGSTREVIVVDDEPWFFRYEHAMKNPKTGRFDLIMGCTRDFDNCPVCAALDGKEGSFNMYLTVIDTTEFTTSDKKKVPFSRKLFVVKSANQKKFLRRFEKDGTLRGAVFELSRDGSKSPAIGNDIEFVEYIDEDALLEYERTYKDRDGKTHKEICHEPFDYEALMPEPDSDSLAEYYNSFFGGASGASPGSRRSNSDEPTPRRRRGHDDEDEDEEEAPKPRRGRKPADDDDDDDDDIPFDKEDGDDEEEAPRGRASRRGKPAPSRRGKQDDDEEPEEEEEVDDEEEEDEKPKARRGANRPSRVAGRKPSRDEDDDEEGDKKKPSSSRGSRRPSARRGK